MVHIFQDTGISGNSSHTPEKPIFTNTIILIKLNRNHIKAFDIEVSIKLDIPLICSNTAIHRTKFFHLLLIARKIL